MNDQPKSKWHWRLLRYGLIGVALLATLVAVLLTEEDWRARHAWKAYCLAAAARGERLDPAALVPPVADDQNFFCAPIVAESLAAALAATGDTHGATQAVDRMEFSIWRGRPEDQPQHGASWQKGELTDLKEWQTYFRTFGATAGGKTNGFPVPAQVQTPAADVLLGLSIFDPALEELRQASLRPAARIPLHYENNFDAASELLPWLATTKRCAQFLELRAVADLQNHQPEAGLADVKLLLRVNDSLRTQPFLISHLVRMAVIPYIVQPIYEGLATHAWSEAQLAELERILAQQDYLADYQLAMRGERDFAIETFERERITRQMTSVNDSSGTSVAITNSLRLWPEAMFYQNQLCFARLDEQILALVDVTNRLVSPTAFNRLSADVATQSKHYSLYKVLALMNAPAVIRVVKKFAFAQAQLDLARVACALDRYRLAHGDFPDTLDSLAPQFIATLPHDLINGYPLHYRRTADGRFVLYSVGWNEKDDGGSVALIKNNVDHDHGDWVWKYPAK